MLALAASCGIASSACGSTDRPGHYQRPVAASDGGILLDGGGSDGPPGADAGGLCGNQFIPTSENRPNVYFVLDRSTTMLEDFSGAASSKYQSASDAIASVLRAVGHRIQYGAAVFPSLNEGCATGLEVFSTRAGDPSTYAAAGRDGPVLQALANTLWRVEPAASGGGTPTAATLTALLPVVSALAGQTFVVLATDGEPNCNADARCTNTDCSLNLRHYALDGIACDASFNCCDPALVLDGQLSCVDGPPTVTAVGALASAGVKTYVIGLPGSEYCANLLDQLAVAGGTASATSPRYVPVSSVDQLSAAVMSIGITLAISCDITLDQTPPDRNLVNVYFDQKLLPSDPDNGWVFGADNLVEIRGLACDQLMSGDVLEVQVVAGCPTVVY
jgi:hypothetical protein